MPGQPPSCPRACTQMNVSQPCQETAFIIIVIEERPSAVRQHVAQLSEVQGSGP